MSVYQERPNVVEVSFADEHGTAVRYVVGKTLDEVIAIIEPEAPVAGPAKASRRARRTKAEMAESVAKPLAEAVASEDKVRDRTWP